MGIRATRLDNVAWHDFSEYNYVLDPVYMSEENIPDYLNSIVVFKPNSVNLGLRIVYRQEWRPLGNQRGEIVKTVPLGPKQVEKVSTKIVRRTKVARTAESLKSVETTTETSETTKDSSEIITEASMNFNWHVEAEGSYTVDALFTKASAKVKAGMGGQLAKKSNEKNMKLSEVMQKTASKIRSETKTVVSTESESTFEIETASEIQNPNEEIATTYVYSKLQRQYEIFTSLAEVHNVIMIALPLPEKIDVAWVKRHDWIIAKVLLDDSYRDALNSISGEPKNIDDDTRIQDIDNKLESIQQGPVSSIAGMELDSLSLSGSEIGTETENYRESLKEQREKIRQELIKSHKWDRLLQHIKDNILHYMRAIWSQEDPQQRMLGLQKLGIGIKTQ